MPLPVRVTPLQPGDRRILEQWVRSRTTPRRQVDRARIVLASAAGQSGTAICRAIAVSRPTVTRWLDRYQQAELAGLARDRPRPGRPKRLSAAQEAAIIRKTPWPQADRR